ncbi:MAG: hypothetical protein ABIZ04_06630 [Opitutus sp.]
MTTLRPHRFASRARFALAGILVGLRVGAAEVTVNWNDNSTDEAGFEIECSRDGNSFTRIATVGANVTSFVDTAAPDNAAWYRVRAFNARFQSDYSNVTGFSSGASSLTSASSSRLTNLSARATPGEGDQSLIVGFVVENGPMSVLVRGIGPGLSSYTSVPTFRDPQLSVRQGSVLVAENDNWAGADPLKAAFARVGAFALSDASKDAAVLTTFAPQGYNASIAGSGIGLAMAEIYDVDPATQAHGRLVNLSVRAQTAPGDGLLIVGFVIAGGSPLRVLIRAAGPGLRALGVTTALADPRLELFRGAVKWNANDNWGGTGELIAAFQTAGAALWAGPSKDAAIVSVLPPGAYTALVSGVDGSSGAALAEVYELP